MQDGIELKNGNDELTQLCDRRTGEQEKADATREVSGRDWSGSCFGL